MEIYETGDPDVYRITCRYNFMNKMYVNGQMIFFSLKFFRFIKAVIVIYIIYVIKLSKFAS